MKKTFLTLLVSSGLFFYSCGGNTTNEADDMEVDDTYQTAPSDELNNGETDEMNNMDMDTTMMDTTGTTGTTAGTTGTSAGTTGTTY